MPCRKGKAYIYSFNQCVAASAPAFNLDHTTKNWVLKAGRASSKFSRRALIKASWDRRRNDSSNNIEFAVCAMVSGGQTMLYESDCRCSEVARGRTCGRWNAFSHPQWCQSSWASAGLLKYLDFCRMSEQVLWDRRCGSSLCRQFAATNVRKTLWVNWNGNKSFRFMRST